MWLRPPVPRITRDYRALPTSDTRPSLWRSKHEQDLSFVCTVAAGDTFPGRRHYCEMNTPLCPYNETVRHAAIVSPPMRSSLRSRSW